MKAVTSQQDCDETYLHLRVIIVIGHFSIWVVLVDAHVHLGNADFLSGQESSDRSLDLDDECKLIHGNPPA